MAAKALRRAAIRLLARVRPLPPLLWAFSERDRRLVLDMQAIRRAGLFDAAWYGDRYPDIAASGMSPLEHYCREGWRRGRDPSPHFSTTLYVVEHPDAARAGNPLAHLARARAADRETADAACGGALESPWYDPKAPELSIVILNYNRAGLTEACVRSLLHHTQGRRYEIIVVDNGSEAADVAHLAGSALPFRRLRLRRNVYFGEGNNIGVEAAAAPLLCLMNNDVIVTAGWLPPLLRVLETRADCGAVGPKFLYPDGRIQEAGAMIDASGDARRFGHGAAPDDPRFAAVREVDYVSAATVLLRTADFLRAGGFDPAWDPAYYEDSDLCLKLSVLGLNTCYCPESSVIHHESVTTSDPRTALKIETLKAINRGIFVERWGGWLAARADQPQAIAGVASIDPPVLLPAPAQPQRPAGRLLLVTDAPLLPGGSVRHLLAFAEALRESHAAWIATPERSSRLRVHAIAAALGLELGAVETLAADETGLLPPFDLAVVASPQAWPGRPAPASRSLLLCHGDKMPPAADLAQCCRWWPGYARLLVGSAAMRQRLLAQLARLDLPAPPVEVLPCPIGPVVPRETAAPGAVTVILNVGRFGGPAAGRQQRLIEAFRLLAVNREMHFELHLAGAISADAADRDAVIRCRQTAGNLPVFFHVNATRRRLQQLYRRADAYWHDVAAAADSIPASPRVSIALLEAMAAGLLCFAPASSAVPIGDGITGCIVDGASDLAGKTRQRLARGSTDAGSIPGRAAAAAAAYAPTALQPRYRRIAAASEESAAEGGGGSRPPT